jgi:hypothetical protein
MFPGIEHPRIQHPVASMSTNFLTNQTRLGISFEALPFDRGARHILHPLQCSTNCSAGWRWLNASDWLRECVATGISQPRCTASVSPRIRVVVYSKVDFVWRGQQVLKALSWASALISTPGAAVGLAEPLFAILDRMRPGQTSNKEPHRSLPFKEQCIQSNA